LYGVPFASDTEAQPSAAAKTLDVKDKHKTTISPARKDILFITKTPTNDIITPLSRTSTPNNIVSKIQTVKQGYKGQNLRKLTVLPN